VNLIKSGFNIVYDIDNYSDLYYDLAPTSLKHKMLKEYYEMITEYNHDELYIKKIVLPEGINNMSHKVKPDEIYYLITESAIFAIQNREYQFIQFLVDKLASEDFNIYAMSKNDVKKTRKTIGVLNDIINRKFKSAK